VKRIIALGDMHCGNFGGLSTPEMILGLRDRKPATYDMQMEMYTKYSEMVKKLTKVPRNCEIIVVGNGDLVDGKKNTQELITADMNEQVTMAADLLKMWEADRYFLTYGTPFHTGKEDDWEVGIAKQLGCPIYNRLFLQADKVNFCFRHKVGRGNVPQSKHTAAARAAMWNVLNAARGTEPNAHVLCFSHVHYHSGSFQPGWLAMTLPALQTTSSFGAKECDGSVDWGLVWFDVEGDRILNWQAEIQPIDGARTKPIKI